MKTGRTLSVGPRPGLPLGRPPSFSPSGVLVRTVRYFTVGVKPRSMDI